MNNILTVRRVQKEMKMKFGDISNPQIKEGSHLSTDKTGRQVEVSCSLVYGEINGLKIVAKFETPYGYPIKRDEEPLIVTGVSP
jgi:hypothetical protein